MSTILRILIVEDSEDDALLLVRHLQRSGYVVVYERVDNAPAMTSVLERQSWDMVIADYVMPSFSGPAALQLLQEKGIDVPFIIVSGTIGEDVAVEAMKAGAHDYVMKGNLTRLIPAIQRELYEVEVRRERKRAEGALRESEDRYRRLFEDSKDAIYISTAEGKFLDINQAGIDLFGYTSSEEALHANIDKEFYTGNPDRNRFREKMAAEGYVRDFEQTLKRKDGKLITVLETATAVYDAMGTVVMYRSIVRDITQQKILEQQFIEVQKMESIGTLAGGIAHDFNNILGIILGYSNLLEARRSNQREFSECVNAISHAVERGAALVQQILTFARKTEVAFMPIYLPDVVHDLFSMLEQTFPKMVSLKESYTPNLPDIYADRTQINQVLLNLCVNARDAMPNGGIILVKMEAQTKEQIQERFPQADQEKYICLCVADSGEGMDDITRIRAFDPFFTTKEGAKGTGLGLSVVYGVVKSHHGFIEVESARGQGTTFRLYFPVSSIANRQIAPESQKNQLEPGGTEAILLVEDESFILEMLQITLASKGYKIFAAKDGLSAIQIYQQYKDEIRLILNDIGLPGISGVSEFKLLKEINPDVKVIFASGYFDPDTKAELQEAGAQGFIQKPYKPGDVLRIIREVLDGKNA